MSTKDLQIIIDADNKQNQFINQKIASRNIAKLDIEIRSIVQWGEIGKTLNKIWENLLHTIRKDSRSTLIAMICPQIPQR